MKKILTLVLAVLMVVSMMPVNVLASAPIRIVSSEGSGAEEPTDVAPDTPEGGETQNQTVIEVSTLAELLSALQDNSNDLPISITTSVEIGAGEEVVLDLNGKTITATGMNVLRNNAGSKLTIKNGTVERTGDIAGYAVSNDNAASVMVLENVTIKGGVYTSGALTATNANVSQHFASRHAIYAFGCEVVLNSGTYHNYNAGNAAVFVANGANVTIKGGTFSIDNGKQTFGWTSNLIDVNNGSCVMNGGEFKGHFRVQANGVLTINGGTFENTHGEGYQLYNGAVVEIKGGTFTDETATSFATKYLAEGYELIDGTVVKTAPAVIYVAQIGDIQYATLAEAFAAAQDGDTIVLLADIVLTESVALSEEKAITLDLNDKTITLDVTGKTNPNAIYAISTLKGKLTIKDSGTNGHIKGVVYTEATTVIENGTFSAADGMKYTILSDGGNVTFNGGTVNGGASYAIYSYGEGHSLTINNVKVNGYNGCLYLYNEGNVTINGGEIIYAPVKAETRHIIYTHSNANIVINGGTFKKEGGVDVSGVGGGGICLAKNAQITIYGGVFNGANGDINDYAPADKPATALIYGGTFSSDVSDYVAEGYELIDGTVVKAAPAVIVAHNRAELQAALDNFKPGTTIELVAGVNYGTVYLRPNPSNPATKAIDWVGNNYVYESYTCFEGLTIKGAAGAIIDVIKIEGGTYYNTEHSQAATYPVMLSLIELKNVTIEGVTFTGNGGQYGDAHGNAISMAGCNIKVDGLTLKNCVLQDSTNNNRLLYKSEATGRHTYTYNGETYTFVADQKNITVTGCTFNGGYMGMELRETENVTITNNTFNGVSSRDILLTPNDGCTFSGKIIITGNTSNGAGNRFVRASGIGNAELTISDNTIINYAGPDTDFIKADGVTGVVTIENNTFDGKVIEAVGENGTYKLMAPTYVAQIGDVQYATLADAIAAAQTGDEIVLLADAAVEGTLAIPAGVTIKSNGHTVNGSIRMLGDLTLNGALTITGGLWVGKSGETLTATLSGDKLTASYFMFQRGTYTINADIDAVYGYLSFEATFNVNSTIHTTGTNGEVLYINGNVTLNDGAVLDSDNSVFLCNAAAVLTMKPGSKVDSNLNITVSGAKLCIDVTGMAAGEYTGITGTVTNSVNGTIEVVNNDKLEAKIVGGKIVLSAKPVAQIGTQGYATLEAAIAAAQADDTIELLADITASQVILIDKSVTIDGNNHTLTSSATRIFRITTGNVKVTMKDLNMVNNAVRVGTNDIRGISIDSDFTGVELTLNNCSVDFTDASATDWSYAVNVVGGSNHTITINGGVYEGANVINIRGESQTVVVKDATLTSLYPDNDVYYGACIYVVQNQNSTVTATGTTFNGSNAVSFNVGYTPVTESNNTHNAIRVVAKIGNTYYTSLADAFAAAQTGDTITLLANVKLSDIFTINKAVTLDGNGKTLTSTAGRAINVSGVDGVTIKNLTIKCSGERAINVIQNATNVTIENVTATAANYTVNIASSAPNAVVAIKNSNLTGLNVVNVSAAGAKVTVDKTALTCNDQTDAETYASLFITNDGANATITATDVTFDIKGDSLKAVVVSATGEITIDGKTDDVMRPVAYISYGINAYTFYTLDKAFEKAQDGDTILLLRDVTVSEAITNTKKVTLDLNGKTITGTDSNVDNKSSLDNFYLINNVGNLTIKDSVGGGKITLKATHDRDINSSSVVIANNPGGKLVVESGTVEHLGGTYMAYAIDNLTNGKGTYAETVINGGTIKSTYRAIRQFLNGVEAQNILTINGGTIEGTNKAVFFHDPSKNANSGTLTIGEKAVINGDIYLFVTDGSTEWPVTVSIAASALVGEIVTKNVPDTYEVEKSNGAYTILPATRVDVSEEALEDILGEIVDDSVTNEEEKEAITEVVTDTVFEIESNTALNDVDYKPVDEHEDVEKLEVTLQDMEVVVSGDTEKTATVIEVTYDVVPMKNDEKVSKPSKPITFRLPIPESMCVNNAYAEVSHEGVLIGVYEIKGDNGGYYVEVTSAEFSAFTVKPVAQNVTYVACIGKVGYTTLADAIAAVQTGETIIVLAGTISEGTIKLPATLENVTIKGAEGAILKDMTISASDGNSYSYIGLTFDGLIFENSRILLTGWRNGDEIIEDLTVTNCVFKNLDDTTNNAAVHVNKDVTEPVKNFTFTNNIVDGLTGGSKSGIYIQATGNVTIDGNTFNNIVFRPALVQLADCDGIADDVVISDNKISNTTRLQVYGSEEGPSGGPWTPSGTDAMEFAISGNIFQNISGQYICTWGINAETDISKNYYDDDPAGRIYWNNEEPTDEVGLAEIGIYPYYTELNDDGTIDTDSLVEAPKAYVAEVNGVQYDSLQAAINAAEGGQTVKLIANIDVDTVYANNKTNWNGDLNYEISVGKDIVLDLNGYTIKSTGGSSHSYYALICVRSGSLEIVDSSEAKTGAIVTDASAIGSKVYAIYNNGSLTVSGGTISNYAAGGYAIESVTVKNTALTINEGANITSVSIAVRVCSQGSAGTQTVVINGGNLSGSYAIWVPIKNGGSDVIDMTIAGGTFTGTSNAILFNTYTSSDYTTDSIKISGGVFNGNVLVGSMYSSDANNTALSAALAGTIVSGGTFSNDLSDYAAEGYQIVDNGNGTFGVEERGLAGSGTEADPYIISTVDDLILFRDSVNAGETKYNASGVWVALGADIDLASENWTPIGNMTYSYMGNFDGNGKTISNLVIVHIALDSDGYAYAGLFGITEGTAGAENIIKDLTIKNVTINTTGHIVAAAIAYPYYTTVSDITVCGDIAIKGGDYTAGVLAYTRHCTTASNLTVSGNNGSCITGKMTVGGVLSDLQLNGGLIANYSNFSASGVTITGDMHVGGIAGIIAGQTLNGATVENVALVCSDARVGIVAGSLGETSTISNVTATNVTGATAIIGAAFNTGKAVEAKIGNTYYATLQAAIDAVAEGGTITLIADVGLNAVVTIEKEITLDLNGYTVTGADGAIVFNVKADTTITNGTILGNKSGTSSGLIDIYANLTMDSVTVETSKIIALRFKAGGFNATLTDCNVTGQFKGYGASVWTIVSGTYKASSTSVNDQLNGTASVSGGTFYYEISADECAPGYAVVDNGDGTYTVKYAPVAFVDVNNNGTLDEGEAVYGSLEAIFTAHKTGDVYIVLLDNTVIEKQVDTTVNAKYYLNTSVADGVTVEFAFADDWNYIQKMYVGDNVTIKAPYLLVWTDLELYGTINTEYLYITTADVLIAEGAAVNANTGEATVQVKNGATLTVEGTVDTAILNVWVGESKLVVSGESAKVSASWIDIWDGTPSVSVENGATLDVDSIKASRGGSIAVTDATLDATSIELGHNGESAGKLTESGNSTITGAIKLTTTDSSVTSDGGLNVTTDIADHKVAYEDGVYKVVECTYVAEVNGTKFETLADALAAAQEGDEIVLLADVTAEGTAAIPAGIKLTSNGYTIDGSIRMLGNLELNGPLTITGGLWVGKSNETLTATLSGDKLTASYFMFQYGTYTINADIDAVYGYLSYSAEFEVNSTIHTTGTNGEVLYINGKVTLNSGAVLDSDNSVFVCNDEASLTLKPGSMVDSKVSITTSGAKVIVDATGMVDGDSANITGVVSNSGNGTIEVINNDKLEAKLVGGKIVLSEKSLSGSGTEADPYIINTVDDLILFRDSVNAGETKYNASGVWVALGADIDLASENWTPIGNMTYSYMGNFDGNGKTISNLVIVHIALDSDGYAYAGLFGITEGTAGAENIIKDLTIKNVTINTTGHIVAAAIAYPYYTTVSDITVCGDIAIKGGDYTAGVLAYTRHCTTASNLTVSGNNGSCITGKMTVGGVLSDLQLNGGLIANYSNFSASGVTITGDMHVGGIAGIIAGQTLNGATVENVALVCSDARVGIVAGSLGETSTISNVTATNVTGATAIIGAAFNTGKAVEAKIGNTYYATIDAAFAAAKSGDTITVLADASMQNVFDVKDMTLTIDGNGKLTFNDKLTVSGVTTLNVSCATGDSITLNDGAILKDSTINGSVFVAGNVTFRGKNTVKMLSDFGTLTDYYGTVAPMAWTVEKGSSLTITEKSRYGLGYGDNVTIYGSLTDALSARESLTDNDVALFMHGLVAQESKGWNCASVMTVKDAYVVIGSNNSFGNKPGNYGGTYTFNFENVVLDASRITFYEALSSTTFNFTKVNAKLGTFMTNDKDSVFILTDTVLLSTTTTNGTDEGNYHAGKLVLNNSKLTYSAPLVLKDDSIIEMDLTSVLEAPSISGNGKIIIDATGFTGADVTAIKADMSGFTGTIELINANKAVYNITDEGVVIVAKILSGTGTAADPYIIKTVDDLILFRDSVNAGETKYNADGVYVALGADIDLAGIDWSVNIGDDCNATFDGIFDGKNHIISNLTSTETATKSDGYICTGLFGAIAGNAVIKNLTLKNVVIDTGNFIGNNVSAVVGFAYNAKGSIESVKVDGLTIKAENATGVGAIVGYDYYSPSLTVKECSVTDATITGKSYVGGVVGYASSKIVISDCSVEDATITGTGSVAGIAGILLSGGKVENATVKSVNVSATGALWANSAAIVAGTMNKTGTVTISGTVYEDVNVTAIVGGILVEKPTTPIAKVEAQIGDTYYATLQAAIDAANDEIVTLLAPITVQKGEELVLDLKGATVTHFYAGTGSYAMIANYGNLIIKDTVGGGKLTFEATNPSANNSYASNTISNYGTITVEDGMIENTSTGGACYALDNYAGSTATIKGGKLVAVKTAVRIFNWTDGEANKATLNINGGEIVSGNGYGVNINSGNAPFVELNIAGGTITTNDTTYNLAVYVVNKNSAENLTINVTGGTFEGNFALNGVTCTTMASDKISISGGTFEGIVCYGTPAHGFVSGGTFKSPVEEEFCAEGYIPTVNADGTYGVKVGAFVAQVGEEKFESLQAAIDAAENNDVITLLADVKEAVTISGKNVTLDLAGKKVYSETLDAISVLSNANVTIKNGTLESHGENCGGVYVKNATLILDNCTLIGENAVQTCTVYASNGANVTIKNSVLEAKDNGTDQNWALIMMSANVTIENSTLTGYHAASSNGSDGYDQGDLTIISGDFNGLIYWPAQGTLTIKGGEIDEILMKSGSLEIFGGTIGDVTINNVADGGYEAIENVEFHGGLFNGTITSDLGKGFISGGTFKTDVTKFCVDGFKAEENDAGTFDIVVDPAYGKAARIEDTYYDSLAEAIAAATANGGTVVLLDDVSEGYIIIPDGVILDLNGRTLTAIYVAAFGGEIIDSKDGVGLLNVSMSRLILSNMTSHLAMYDEDANGYRFFEFTLKSGGTNVSANQRRYAFRLEFENAGAYDLLAKGAASTGVSIQFTLWWNDADAKVHTFADNIIASTFTEENMENSSWALLIHVNGLENSALSGTTLCANFKINVAGASVTSKTNQYSIPVSAAE